MKPTPEKYLHKVVKIKKPIFEDGYLDVGMMGRITAIIDDPRDDMVKIVFDLSEFKEHNIANEQSNWYPKGFRDKNRCKLVTASEAGWYPDDDKHESYYFMYSDNLDDYVEIVENPLDTRAAMLETLKMAYQIVLDDCVFVGQNPDPDKKRRLTREQEQKLAKNLVEYWGMK